MLGFSAGLTLGAQLYFIWYWHGVWRWLAAAPLMLMAAFIASIPVLVLFEPRIGDTWHLFLVVINCTGMVWLVLLALTRLFIRWTTVF
jgi:hypothetical protein